MQIVEDTATCRSRQHWSACRIPTVVVHPVQLQSNLSAIIPEVINFVLKRVAKKLATPAEQMVSVVLSHGGVDDAQLTSAMRWCEEWSAAQRLMAHHLLRNKRLQFSLNRLGLLRQLRVGIDCIGKKAI